VIENHLTHTTEISLKVRVSVSSLGVLIGQQLRTKNAFHTSTTSCRNEAFDIHHRRGMMGDGLLPHTKLSFDIRTVF
jgi:hypothetical protein